MAEKNSLYDMAERLSEDDVLRFEGTFEDFGSGAEITAEQKQRILSSTLRKAGAEMTNGIRMTRTHSGEEASTINEGMSTLRRGHTLAACIAAVVVAAAAGAVILHSRLPAADIEAPAEQQSAYSETRQAEVPNVVLMSESQAEAALRAAGFTPIKRETFDETEAGLVILTEPVHGELTEEGSEVVYYVSLGPIGANTSDREQLLDYAETLYGEVISFQGETLAGFNADNGTSIAIQKPDDSMDTERLRELCEEYEKLLGMTADEYYDYLRSLCSLTENVTTVTAQQPEEAEN